MLRDVLTYQITKDLHRTGELEDEGCVGLGSVALVIMENSKELHSLKEISEVIIRRAAKSDAKSLIDYLDIIGGESDFLTFGPGQFGRSVEQEEEFIKSVLTKENALFIVAEVDGKLVGNLNFSGGPRQRNAHVGEFGVSVLREYWGNGIGEKLIQYLVEWGKDSGIIRKINLRVRSDNTRGIYLYKKIGFIEEGIVKRDFIINDKFYDSMIMGLPID